MNILTSAQFSLEDINNIFALADDIQDNYAKYEHSLTGKILATLFYEPSTRTRLSFESAVQRLGGKIISTENAQEVSSAVKGESLSDTIRVISGYCDGIILRHFDTDSAVVASSVSHVPIINAGSGSGEHPTQALLDLYTIYRNKKTLNNLKIAFVGDLAYGRTVHSLIKLLAKYEGNAVICLSRPSLSLPQEYINAISHSNRYVSIHDINNLPKDVDVIYQTRNQVERFKNDESEFNEFSINNEFLNSFNEDLILMHPLPRNAEINIDCDQNPRAFYFEQAHSGIPIRMALLVYTFKK